MVAKNRGSQHDRSLNVAVGGADRRVPLDTLTQDCSRVGYSQMYSPALTRIATFILT